MSRAALHSFFTRGVRPVAPPPSVEAPRRRPPVVATTLPMPAVVRSEATADTCACGSTYTTDPAVWSELLRGRVVAFCPACSSTGGHP